MLDNEAVLLYMVKSYFNSGNLWNYNKYSTVWFRVRDFSSIKNEIMPHFLKYPLRGTKYLDFMSFKNAFEIVINKGHLIEEGLNLLDNISKNNKSRKFTNVDYSPDHTKENNIKYIPINGHYINGFIAGDGCLSVGITKNFGAMTLSISQHKNNRLLIENIAKYFKSPSKVYLGRPKDIQIVLSNAQLWKHVIFEHFSKYPIHETKKLKLNKLILIKELKEGNKYLKQVGKYREWKPEYKLRIMEIWKN